MQKEKKKVDRNLLAITDFTQSSTNAILFAGNLFKDTNLKFTLVNVFETPIDKGNLLISVDDILKKDSETGLKKQSAEITLALKEKGLNLLTYSVEGKLKKGISMVTQSEKIDLIVAGIPSGKYSNEHIDKISLFLMGQSRYPVLLVPENSSQKTVKSVLILNMSSNNTSQNTFESIINHDHIAKHIINLNETKIDNTKAALNKIITNEKIDLMIIIPAPGDKIDRALLDYQVQELYPLAVSLLNS